MCNLHNQKGDSRYLKHGLLVWECCNSAFILDTIIHTYLSENRYLLFLTENYAALEILRHYLHDVVGSAFPGDPVWEEEGRPERMDPFILFGSSFPKDKEYTQVNYLYQEMLKGTKSFLLNEINCRRGGYLWDAQGNCGVAKIKVVVQVLRENVSMSYSSGTVNYF